MAAKETTKKATTAAVPAKKEKAPAKSKVLGEARAYQLLGCLQGEVRG